MDEPVDEPLDGPPHEQLDGTLDDPPDERVDELVDERVDEQVEELGEPDGAPEAPTGRRYPSTIGGAFYIAVLICAGVGIGIVLTGDWRAGVRVLAAGLAVASASRLVLPRADAGMLAVRHRSTDVLLLAAVAGVLWWLAGSIPDQPSP